MSTIASCIGESPFSQKESVPLKTDSPNKTKSWLKRSFASSVLLFLYADSVEKNATSVREALSSKSTGLYHMKLGDPLKCTPNIRLHRISLPSPSIQVSVLQAQGIRWRMPGADTANVVPSPSDWNIVTSNWGPSISALSEADHRNLGRSSSLASRYPDFLFIFKLNSQFS